MSMLCGWDGISSRNRYSRILSELVSITSLSHKKLYVHWVFLYIERGHYIDMYVLSLDGILYQIFISHNSCVQDCILCNFLCSTCIAGEFQCEGEPCKEIECAEDEFLCFDAQKCINNENLCDSVMDCSDGSDELNCSMYISLLN